MDNEAVLKKIEEINKSKEWSMYKLSKESGIAQSTLSSLFGRRANISLPKLGKICQAFGLKLSDFFSMLEEAEASKQRQSDYEMIELIQKAEFLSKNNRRLLRSMIIVMEELEKEKNKKESGINGKNS